MRAAGWAQILRCTQNENMVLNGDIFSYFSLLLNRFKRIDKLPTAMGTDNSQPCPYRFAYDVLDANLNGL